MYLIPFLHPFLVSGLKGTVTVIRICLREEIFQVGYGHLMDNILKRLNENLFLRGFSAVVRSLVGTPAKPSAQESRMFFTMLESRACAAVLKLLGSHAGYGREAVRVVRI